MASEERFVYTDSIVDIRRSKFNMPSHWKGAIYHGDLVPLEITRVMPGDSAIYDLSLFVRTATPPIAPFMDSVKLSVAAFYVPERLVWSKEKEFMGENTEGYGIQTEVLAPRTKVTYATVTKASAAGGRTLAGFLGLVRQKDSLENESYISLNPYRSFLQVYNDWFRNENFHNPYLWDHNQTGDGERYIATIGGTGIIGATSLPRVCKNLDRFTSCLPWAQKGSPVLLPLGTSAPVVADSSMHDMGLAVQAGKVSGTSILPFSSTNKWRLGGLGDSNVVSGGNSSSVGDGDYSGTWQASNLVTDLSQATAASINQLRLAFATQRYLETLARTGSKYREVIRGLFGVSIGDTTAQMAEYLGGMTIELNVDQVLQSTGYASGSSSRLGAPGASSTSAASQSLFTKSFNEPGFLVIVGYTKHQRTYGQGIDEIWQKHDILEEYNPKFANIGEQAIKKSNLYFTGELADDDTRFGFQEAWSEYRYKKDIVIGALNPANTGSYNFWSLADNYETAPVLNSEFLLEDRANIARCLQGGSESPDYFLDIKFRRTFVRPMPLYSIPGLIDHH